MHFLLTGQEPLALQVSAPRKHNVKISERTDLLVQRATAQDIWLRFQTAPEMKEELERALLPSKSENVKMPSWLVAVATFIVVVVCLFGYARFSDMNKNRDEEKEANQKLQRELKQVVNQQHSKDKELDLLRHYATSEKATEETRQTGVQISEIGGMPKSTMVTTAFKETDEAQLTDPEGLPPISADEQTPVEPTASSGEAANN